jgi:tRNA (cytidine/uridine-2'-O-)-methyltransferase
LDYWYNLDLQIWDHFEDLYRHHPQAAYFYATTKARQTYAEVVYPEEIMLVFGKETKGLPEEMLLAHPERCIRIPMLNGNRSLNLSNAVAVIAYEALRQHAFTTLDTVSDFLPEHSG